MGAISGRLIGGGETIKREGRRNMNPGDIEKLLSGTVGAVGVLTFFVLAFMRGYIVPGKIYDDLARDRDYWRSLADRTANTARRLVPPADAESGRGRRP
jgi:peptidoglycan/LPS O-acetylase OafA/YrhL